MGFRLPPQNYLRTTKYGILQIGGYVNLCKCFGSGNSRTLPQGKKFD